MNGASAQAGFSSRNIKEKAGVLAHDHTTDVSRDVVMVEGEADEGVVNLSKCIFEVKENDINFSLKFFLMI